MKKIFLLTTALALFACQKEPTQTTETPSANSNFEFRTSNNVHISLSADAHLAGASFELYTSNPLDGGVLFGKGILDNQGQFEADYQLGIDLNTIFLKSTYIGLPGDIELSVQSDYASFNFNEPAPKRALRKNASNLVVTDNQGNIYKHMGGFDANGVPDYLTVSDNIDASLLDDINAALPEQDPVPNAHPEYLASGNDVDLHITQLCDVWITFVHEGAGYRNVLGFYTYPTNNPPNSVADIDTTHIIFPNTSYSGSGGGLTSGNKVHLGVFQPGTSIGWVLIQNAYNTNSASVNVNSLKFYSNTSFNPEANASHRQHNVQLLHEQRELVLIGFEDIQRDAHGCDNDFNDAIYYVTSNPIEAIDNGNLPTIGSTNNDQDNDGVDDNSDEYPTDPNRAFNQYYPDAHNFASLAFEDLWPSQGDYDFNDLVLDQQFRFITSANNMIQDIEIKLVVRHIGASYHNGFGISLPIPESDINSITGYNITDGLVSLNAKGLENNQSKAVLMAFDDAFDNLEDTLTLNISLTKPYNLSQFNQEGTNPFLFVNATRGREVHLTNKAPTDLADNQYFGIKDDISAPENGVYYRSNANYPWAIEINKNYMAPKEKVNIEEAYKHFADWVNTNGTTYKDWFSKATSDYRDFSKVQN